MRYFTPTLDVRPQPGMLRGIATSFSREGQAEGGPSFPEKLGGLPEGLPPAAWPRCRDCDGPMSLVGQFDHHPERLPLGHEGRRLFVFMCDNDPGMCATWEAESGANACLVLEPEEIAALPLHADTIPAWHEAIIVGWRQGDDGIPESLRESFFSDSTYYGSPGQPGLAEADGVPMETRFGSVPRWLQGAAEGPAGYDYLGQIDCQMRFTGEPNHIEPWMSRGEDQSDALYWAEGPNFGDGGIAYLFADRSCDPPTVRMFWQCL